MKKFLTWIDQHGMFALSLFLLLFIPLYPKLPLLDAIPGYLVRIRLEDIAVGVVGVAWFIQLLRKKVSPSWPVVILVGGYAIVGLLSLLIAIFLQQTIPLQLLHIGKSGLHYGRYLEYFSLFFFLHSSIKTKRHLQIAVTSIVISLLVITVYGFGQRYWQWPVFSTMNREYSKGAVLTLSADARVNATFGGHYDLAAYLVIVLPILFSLILFIPSKKIKLAGLVVAAGSIWLLLASAQKTSLIAFLAATAVVWFSYLSSKFGWVKTFIATGVAGGVGVVLLVIFLNTVGGKYAVKINNALAGKPSDLPEDFVGGQLDENWSENAMKYGLSMGIRLDTLWPQALYGFSINPWTGKGYATLNKLGLNEFTEADSTDNNYFRMLGETGLTGSILFLGIIWYLWHTIRQHQTTEPLTHALVLGYTAGLVGLLFNASIIDVFAASKVAFSFWGLTGLVLAAVQLGKEKQVAEHDKKVMTNWLTKFQTSWPLIITLLLFVLLAHKRPFSEFSPVQGFSFAQSTAIYAHAASCLATSFNSCQTILSRLSWLDYPYVAFLTPWYRLFNLPSMYYFANLLATVVGLWLWNRWLTASKQLSIVRFAVLVAIVGPIIKLQLTSTASPANLIIPIVGGLLVWLSSQKLSSRFMARVQKVTLKRPQLTGGVALAALSISLIFMSGGEAASIVLKNFRDGYDVHQYRAVRRMNDFMKNIAQQNAAPVMTTFLSRDYVELFNQNTYPVLPPPTATTADYYRQLLKQETPLYFTNAAAAIEDTASLSTTLTLADLFSLTLNTIDCEHRCNVYTILDQPAALPVNVESANQVQFNQQDQYTLLLASNQVARFFNPNIYLPLVTKMYSNALLTSSADGYIFVGDSVHKVEENHGSFFRTQFIDQVKKPVVYATSNHTVTQYAAYGPAQQRFKLGNTMVLTLDDSVTDHPTAQQLLIIDTLLQLYQHPEITDLVVISNSLNWAQALTAADKNTISQYTEVSNLRWHVISAQSKNDRQANELSDYIHDEITYLGMNSHSEPINLFWQLSISQSGVEITPVQVQTSQLNISDYLKKTVPSDTVLFLKFQKRN